ncbi:MAG: Mrp/NBP35 family ATP-binding protein [Planctomycetales bacterium]|nr:Mrp/NBP35 family ATP-binding protein [Planctomycetales bacterium]
MSNITETQILDCLKDVRDPEIGRSLIDLKMVKQARSTADGGIDIEIDLPTHAYPRRERIAQSIEAVVMAKLPDVSKITVKFSVNTRGKDTGGSIGLRVKNVVAVGSGKGGVGKSTVAASLAYGLHLYGARVGLMDADVYGPSIPHMLGLHARPEIVDEPGDDGKTIRRIEPPVVNGLKVMSMGLFVAPDEAVVWRGPMLHGAITQFLKDTRWGELDYLIIDLPPGTGDVSLTLSQLLGLAGAVVVCTPQEVALLDAVKALNMFRKVKIPVLGMVENMSGDIFGRGGTMRKAAELGVPFLGEIPMNAQLRVNGDAGRIADNFADDNPSAKFLRHMCEQTAMQIARQLLESPTMPTLEIL